MNRFRTLGLGLLLAASACTAARAAPVDELQKSIAALVAGRYAAKSCWLRNAADDEKHPGTMTIDADGDIAAPSFQLSMFDPAAEVMFERTDTPGQRPQVSVQVAANGHSLRLIGPGFDPSSPGSLEAGVGSPNLNITDGTLCDDMSVAPARLAAPGFDFASYLVPAFQTGARPVKGSCRPARTLKGPARPVSFSLDAHGVVVDGVTLPFGPAAKPVNHVALGSRYADGTLNLSIDWADGSSFHAEREIGGDAFAMFGFTLHGRPDADMQTCRVAP